MEAVTVITPTGGRPQAFTLCRRWMSRQTYRGTVQWLVVDDCDPPTALPELEKYGTPFLNASGCEVQVIRPELRWQHGQNTLARNLLAVLDVIRFEKVVFVEDDDWYSADYLEFMSGLLDKHEIVGEAPARYYHVPSRLYRTLPNARHASLCQTGIRADIVPRMREICREPSGTFIDVRLWEGAPRAGLSDSPGHCVGMKGLPGRAGIGIGHRPEGRGADWKSDTDRAVLRSWLGNTDAEAYLY
jgi:hypothetical protein